jgi:hypothetical protein
MPVFVFRRASRRGVIGDQEVAVEIGVVDQRREVRGGVPAGFVSDQGNVDSGADPRGSPPELQKVNLDRTRALAPEKPDGSQARTGEDEAHRLGNARYGFDIDVIQ